MKILVTVASKHGSTYEIAKAIGSELATGGLDVSVMPVQDVKTIDEYDAVILGSAIHMGQWMKPAKEFVARVTAILASRPVWLFSRGPVTDRSKPNTVQLGTRSSGHWLVVGQWVVATTGDGPV